jgi:hypothetical protein
MVRHIQRMVEMRNSLKNSVGTSEVNGRPRYICEDDIKMDVKV